MSEIVSGVLKITFGILANKIRKEVANRLKDGDVTDEECRRLIVRELDDIKSKLDGLARKDLLSSLCFLQEGVNRLYQSLLQLSSNENAAESTEAATAVEATSCRDTHGSDSPISDAVALISAISSLKIRSSERFKSAVDSFMLAREKATDAFCNEALSIEDRIQASQIRIMARMLECLEDPDAAISDCLQYLKQLHDLGGVREVFSVLFDGGFKSRFNQTKRMNNLSSVYIVSRILFDFAKKFTKLPIVIFAWPTISLRNGTLYHPVFGDSRLGRKLKESGVKVLLPSRFVDFTFDSEIDTQLSVLNSKGEIVAKLSQKNTFKIFNRSGESRTLCEVPREENAEDLRVVAMDIDTEDNIYVITGFRKSSDHLFRFMLFMFDANGHKKIEHPLAFLQNAYSLLARIAISKDGQIAIFNFYNLTLYIGRVNLNSFTIDKTVKNFSPDHRLGRSNPFLLCSYSSGVKIIIALQKRVVVYSENGKLDRKIEIPNERGHISSAAINHVTKGLLIKTNQAYRSCSLLTFSETRELIGCLNLGSTIWMFCARVITHPNGTVALIDERGAVQLQ